MMKRLVTMAAIAAVLSGCNGGGPGGSTLVAGSGNGGGGTVETGGGGSGSSACSLRARQDWALGRLNEWYLFPETLPASLDPTPYTTVGAYVDALTATAREQRKDRYFTYLTSIAEENAFLNSGASAGFGIRLSTDGAARRAFVSEAFEGAPALAAGIDRGTEILAVGEVGGTLRTVTDIIAAEGTGGVSAALGPNTAGTQRVLRVSGAGGQRELTLAKADYTITPVSSRYGARVIQDGGRAIGYINLRTFIATADNQLRSAFATFKAAGVRDVVVDLRYNGGGLVDTAALFGDLLAAARSTSDVQDYVTFRPSKSSNNSTRTYRREANAIAPVRIAFIGTGATASASELVINQALPYFGENVALIGSNTFGKPVGQNAYDRAECDDRLRVVAFATQNAARQGDYYDGLASKVPQTCAATDDTSRQLGDPQEGMLRTAIDFLNGRSCTRIAGGQTTQVAGASRAELLGTARPSAAQRDMPGLF